MKKHMVWVNLWTMILNSNKDTKWDIIKDKKHGNELIFYSKMKNYPVKIPILPQ
jgi:hypothetical protein